MHSVLCPLPSTSEERWPIKAIKRKEESANQKLHRNPFVKLKGQQCEGQLEERTGG